MSGLSGSGQKVGRWKNIIYYLGFLQKRVIVNKRKEKENEMSGILFWALHF